MSIFQNCHVTRGVVTVSSADSAISDLRRALESDKSLDFDRPLKRESGEFSFWLPDSYPIWDATWSMEDYMQLFLIRISHNVDLDSQLKLFVDQEAATPMLVIEFGNECYVSLSYGHGLYGAKPTVSDPMVLKLDFCAKRRANNLVACQSFASVAKVWNVTEVMKLESNDQPGVRFPKKYAGLPQGDFSSGRQDEGDSYPSRIVLACNPENLSSFVGYGRDTIAALEALLGKPLMARFVLQAMGEENRKKMVAHSLTISDKWDMEFYGQYAKGFSPFEPIPDLKHPRIFPVVVAQFTDQADRRFDQVLDMQISVRHQPDQPIDLLLHSGHNFEFMRRIASSAGLEVEQLPDRFPDGPTR